MMSSLALVSLSNHAYYEPRARQFCKQVPRFPDEPSRIWRTSPEAYYGIRISNYDLATRFYVSSLFLGYTVRNSVLRGTWLVPRDARNTSLYFLINYLTDLDIIGSLDSYYFTPGLSTPTSLYLTYPPPTH